MANLRLVEMPTANDTAKRRARTAWWLRACRLSDPRRPKLAAVGDAAGLGEGSGSVVSLWERNLAKNGPRLDQLERLAAFYGVPLSLFTDPPETDEERLSRLRQLSLAALDDEQRDWESGEGAEDPDDEAGLDEPPARRSA